AERSRIGGEKPGMPFEPHAALSGVLFVPQSERKASLSDSFPFVLLKGDRIGSPSAHEVHRLGAYVQPSLLTCPPLPALEHRALGQGSPSKRLDSRQRAEPGPTGR
ncbi:hypothetical protein H1C71_035175, partial [Ictidomys tridecemlineatus]